MLFNSNNYLEAVGINSMLGILVFFYSQEDLEAKARLVERIRRAKAKAAESDDPVTRRKWKLMPTE